MKLRCVCLSMALFLMGSQVMGGNNGQSESENSLSDWGMGNIEGTIFLDNNSDKLFDLSDEPIEGVSVAAFHDLNLNGIRDIGDPQVAEFVSDIDGKYSLEVFPTNVRSIKSVVNASSDDAVQNEPNGIMVLDGDRESGVREIGFRFTNINIPKGAEIISASLTVTAASANQMLTEIIVSGEASANAVTFSTQNYDLWNRPRTASVIEWQPFMEVEMYTPLEIQGVEDIVEEIISQDEWAEGNALVMIIADFNNDIFMFDGGFAPQLNIVYRNSNVAEVQYIIEPNLSNVPVEYDPSTAVSSAVVITESNMTATDVDFGFSQAVVLAEATSTFNEVSMDVWPNPTTGPVSIHLSGLQSDKKFSMLVFDLQGRMVENKEVVMGYNSQLNYNMSHLSKGVYVIGLSDGTEMLSKKVILQ